jgi:hypothetical protein
MIWVIVSIISCFIIGLFVGYFYLDKENETDERCLSDFDDEDDDEFGSSLI